MLQVTCATCCHVVQFDSSNAGRAAECPQCSASLRLIPDQIEAICEILKQRQLAYCKQLREHFQQDCVNGIKLQQRPWHASMSFEVGTYLFFWLEDILLDFPQSPLTSVLLNVHARDTILLNTTPVSPTTQKQIAQIRRAIEHRAYGTLPSSECRRLIHHLLDAIEYRFQKYSTCRTNGKTYGHVASCCWKHIEQFLARSTDDLSNIALIDGPITLVGDFFDGVYLINALAALEQAYVIPYRCILQNLFAASSDILSLELNQLVTIVAQTMSENSSRFARIGEDCVMS